MTAYQTRPRAQRSITSHRLFPPLVALWFGALFGLSSLAVRTGLFEQMVISSGFDRLVPAASPPLGHTARLLIALVFALIGAGIGNVVARIVAGHGRPSTYGDNLYPPASGGYPAHDDYRVRARDAHPDAPARRPISAHDELGNDSLIAGGIAASDWTDDDFGAPRWHDPEAAVAVDPPMPAWFQPQPPSVEPVAAIAPEMQRFAPEPAPEVLPEPAAQPAPPAPEASPMPPAWRNTAERIEQAHPSALSQVELIERLAMAINRKQDEAVTTGGYQAGWELPPEGEAEPAHRSAVGDTPVADHAPHGKPEAEATIKALRDALSSLRQN